MNKINSFVCLLAIFGASGMAQAASTGTITFEGELTATTCDVSVNGGSESETITLPVVGTNQLTEAGNTAGRTGFVLGLSDCAGTLKTASAFFEAGSSVDLVTGRLNNMTGTAKNVSLQLRDDSSDSRNVIQVGNTNQVAASTYVDVSSGSANLPYSVEYYANGEATAGTVVSNVVYSLQYK